MALLAAEHLTFTYPGAAEPALDDVSLEVPAGAFVVLCGASGSGKTTLLRHFAAALQPTGQRAGRVVLEGRPLAEASLREQASAVGYVGPRAEAQMACATVGAELAFGLENLGAAPDVIGQRVAETASLLGVAPLLHRPTHGLSGGQAQLVCLAAALALRPRAIVLDEPFAHLDPLAARALMDALGRLCREQGIAVVMADHRLEGVLAQADHVAVMDRGRIACQGAPGQVARALLEDGSPLAAALPASARIAMALGCEGPLPLDVRAGQRWLRERLAGSPPAASDAAQPPLPAAAGARASGMGAAPVAREAGASPRGGRSAALDAQMAAAEGGARALAGPDAIEGSFACEVRGACFRYGRDGADVLRQLSLRVPQGGIHGLAGGNGAGKSTLLKVLAGALRPYSGRVLYTGAPAPRRGRPPAALLPQEPLDLFAADTVGACLDAAVAVHGPEAAARRDELAGRLGVAALLGAHPRDLSAGELQRAALALVLLGQPRLLLLDEPTRGLDAPGSHALAELLHGLASEGATVLMATHDLEFCAEHARTMALLFDGAVAAQAPTRPFFASMAFCAPEAALVARPMIDDAVTVGQVVARCRG